MDSHGHLLVKQGVEGIPVDDYFFLQMSNGVTSVRCRRYEFEAMGLRDSLRQNKIISPRLYLSK